MIVHQGNYFYLNTKSFSIIIEEREGYLFLNHVGKKINHYHGATRVYERDHAFSGNPTPDNRTFSFDTQRQVIGQHGLGDFREPSIRIQHHQNEVTDFRFDSYQILDGAVDAKGLPSPHSTNQAKTICFILKDSVARLTLSLYYTTYEEEDTITSHYVIHNEGNKEVVVHRLLSTMLDLPKRDYEVITLQGAYGREKTLRRQPVQQGLFKISSNRGASGHAQTPAMVLVEKETNEDYGEALAMQLIYSGNFQTFVQENQLGEVRVGIGINDDNFSWLIKPQADFTTPIAMLTYSDRGLSRLSEMSQRFVQKHLVSPSFANQERPILINNWEATYFDFTKPKLLELAGEASKLGIELFVLDDGWFGKRDDDNRSLGDWYVNEQKLGGTLNQLIQEVHQQGLKFGIWVEPEMISQDSDLYRTHPEWVISAPGREHTYSRNQLVLDFSNPAVVKHTIKWLDALLSAHPIDYVKWDMNRNITKIGNGQTYLETRMQSHAYMLGLYEVLEYITTKHQQVLFESCSGGGGRNDLGMMRYFPQVWASDDTDAIERLMIQYGSSYLYPTITMGSHVSAIPNHQVNRITPLSTRGDVAMMGNLGYELDLTSLTSKEKEEIKAQVEQYKVIRPIVQFGRQYRLINPDNHSNETAVQFVYRDESVVTYVRICSTIETMESTLRLKGLEEEALYQLVGTEQIYSGSELMYAGLTMVMPVGDYLSRQLHFVKI